MADMAEIPVDLPTEMVEKITEDVELNMRQGNITVLMYVLSDFWYPGNKISWKNQLQDVVYLSMN